MFTLIFLVIASVAYAIDVTRRVSQSGTDSYDIFYIVLVVACFILIGIHEAATISRALT